MSNTDGQTVHHTTFDPNQLLTKVLDSKETQHLQCSSTLLWYKGGKVKRWTVCSFQDL